MEEFLVNHFDLRRSSARTQRENIDSIWTWSRAGASARPFTASACSEQCMPRHRDIALADVIRRRRGAALALQHLRLLSHLGRNACPPASDGLELGAGRFRSARGKSGPGAHAAKAQHPILETLGGLGQLSALRYDQMIGKISVERAMKGVNQVPALQLALDQPRRKQRYTEAIDG
jgi:hypothetical protein